MATNDYSPANKIGEGGFGSVYKVKRRFILNFHRLLVTYIIDLYFTEPTIHISDKALFSDK